MKRIVLHVDRLVLNGIRREEGAAFAESLRRELTRQFSTPDAARQLASHGNTPRVTLPVIRVHAAPAVQTGAQVARGIARE